MHVGRKPPAVCSGLDELTGPVTESLLRRASMLSNAAANRNSLQLTAAPLTAKLSRLTSSFRRSINDRQLSLVPASSSESSNFLQPFALDKNRSLSNRSIGVETLSPSARIANSNHNLLEDKTSPSPSPDPSRLSPQIKTTSHIL
ncbi:hypothetical protein Ciccas_014197 [Cichlidogyrus casuarinus]|uniref:Uncharacterized protein n=1 Tax=Cichlidogyrus casuarinus TaxID=1844966 RepID=A0ABD2PK24_9PLAT